MGIIERIEQRVALPGDGETERSRKTLATTVLFAASLALSIQTPALFFNGLTTIAWQYALFALSSLLAGLLVLAFPRSYGVVVRIFLIVSILFSAVAQVYFGGYTSGVYAMPWAIMLPLGAVLFFGAGFTFVSLGVFAATLVALILLEPLAIALAPQIETAVLLSINTLSLALLCLMVALASLYLLRQVERYRTRANNLLLNMLPESIASRLKDSSETIADAYGEATVLFADMVGSTPLFADLEPAEIVDWLNEVFSMFDRLVDKYGLEKIRTIGDNYMVASGVPVPRDDHAQAMALLALDMLRGLQEIPTRQGKRMAFRVGINSGPLVAGVIGESKYQYDLWGDTVNIASRMESHGEAGRVHISKATYELLKEDFDCMSREKIAVKGKGEMETYYLVGPKSG